MNIAIAEPPIKNELIIPNYLIKEEINGKPYAYKGYKSVLSNEKKLEEIMGCSTLQAFIIDYILKSLYRQLADGLYYIHTNESGLHLKHRSNVSCDIVIYEKATFSPSKINKHYSTVAPKVVIEVDVDIDLQEDTIVFSNNYKYIREKIDALFAFGVEKVIWVLSDSKQIIVATPSEDWRFVDWNKDILIIDDVYFNIGKFFEKEGIEL